MVPQRGWIPVPFYTTIEQVNPKELQCLPEDLIVCMHSTMSVQNHVPWRLHAERCNPSRLDAGWTRIPHNCVIFLHINSPFTKEIVTVPKEKSFLNNFPAPKMSFMWRAFHFFSSLSCSGSLLRREICFMSQLGSMTQNGFDIWRTMSRLWWNNQGRAKEEGTSTIQETYQHPQCSQARNRFHGDTNKILQCAPLSGGKMQNIPHTDSSLHLCKLASWQAWIVPPWESVPNILSLSPAPNSFAILMRQTHNPKSTHFSRYSEGLNGKEERCETVLSHFWKHTHASKREEIIKSEFLVFLSSPDICRR